MLKTQLDNGQVPDFHQYNVHVTASLLKVALVECCRIRQIYFQEYLRSIPGQLLISGNYRLWMEISDESDEDKKLKSCRNLLRLLPASHTVLLTKYDQYLYRFFYAQF